jgi:putative toxin-antitoxin system antitoxin component (TIGR02293 family)
LEGVLVSFRLKGARPVLPKHREVEAPSAVAGDGAVGRARPFAIGYWQIGKTPPYKWHLAEVVMTLAAGSDTGSGLFRELPRFLGLGSSVGSDRELAEAVERGLTSTTIDALRAAGLTAAELGELVLPARTLAHRRARGGRLSAEESDRAARVARLLALASAVFGDSGRALAWLRRPSRRLSDRAPLDLLASDSGTRVVEEMLYRIDDGIAA